MKPREKFLKYGVKNLSDEELISIIIGTGNKKYNVYDISKKVNSLLGNDLSGDYFSLIDKIPQIGKYTKMKLISSLEFGYRKSKKNNISIKSPRDVWLITSKYFDKISEKIIVLFLNARNEVVGLKEVAKGRDNCVSLDIKEILYEAIKLLSSNLIIVHNHPSGNLVSSEEDVHTTENISKACDLIGMKLLDHIIVTEEGFKSIK